jgi:hypothetical protein
MIFEMPTTETPFIDLIENRWICIKDEIRLLVGLQYPRPHPHLDFIEEMFLLNGAKEMAVHQTYSKNHTALIVRSVSNILNSEEFLTNIYPSQVIEAIGLDRLRQVSKYHWYPYNFRDLSGTYTKRAIEALGDMDFEIPPNFIHLPDFLRGVFLASITNPSKKYVSYEILQVSMDRVTEAISILRELFPDKEQYPWIHVLGERPKDIQNRLKHFVTHSCKFLVNIPEEFKMALEQGNIQFALDSYEGIYKDVLLSVLKTYDERGERICWIYLMLNYGIPKAVITNPFNGFYNTVMYDNDTALLKRLLFNHFSKPRSKKILKAEYNKDPSIYTKGHNLSQWVESKIQNLSIRAKILLQILIKNRISITVTKFPLLLKEGKLNTESHLFKHMDGNLVFTNYTGRIKRWKASRILHNEWKEIVLHLGFPEDAKMHEFWKYYNPSVYEQILRDTES